MIQSIERKKQEIIKKSIMIEEDSTMIKSFEKEKSLCKTNWNNLMKQETTTPSLSVF